MDMLFYRVSRVRKSKCEPLRSIAEYIGIADKRARGRVRGFGNRVVRSLECIDADAYAEFYSKEFIGKLPRYASDSFVYAGMSDGVKDVGEVRKFFKGFVGRAHAVPDVCFRNVDFVYRYLFGRLDYGCGFVSKSDIEELIGRCDRVLENNELAGELLPAIGYDDCYFADVWDVMFELKGLLGGFNEDTDVMFVVMC